MANCFQGYLYGTETTGPKLTLLDIPNPSMCTLEQTVLFNNFFLLLPLIITCNVCVAALDDCPDFSISYAKAIDGLKLMVDIKPKVIVDAIAIRDKFPCHETVKDFVKGFVSNFFRKWKYQRDAIFLHSQ